MRARSTLIVVIVMLAVLLAGCDWTMFHATAGQSSMGADAGFSPTSATSATLRWRWTPDGPTAAGQPTLMYASPVTYKGHVFIGSGEGDFYSVNLKTGVTEWKHKFGWTPNITCDSLGITATAAVRADTNGNPIVYLNSPDGYLYELNGLTGSTLHKSEVLKPTPGTNDAYGWSSPIIANGLVYVGVSSNCDFPFVDGGVKAYDQNTLAPVAGYVSNDNGGGGVWTTIATDGSAVYTTTGSTTFGAPDQDSYSIVKLHPTTLAKLGKFTVPLADRVYDADWGSSPVLFHATIGGTSVPMAGACNKNGYFYAVRTDTMALVWRQLVGTGSEYGQIACLSGGIWDAKAGALYVGSNDTTIASVSYPGAVRRLDPATGTPLWQRGLAANPLGSGSLDGSGVLAFTTTDWVGAADYTYLIDPSDGRVIRRIANDQPGFSSPAWVDGSLLVTTTASMAAYR